MTPIRRLIPLLIVLLLASASQGADKLICAQCGKAIDSGSYFQADGRYYHANHFVCSHCGQSIGSQRYWTRDGKLYDSTCFVNLFHPRCSYCNRVIAGKWLTIDGREYHDSCYNNHVADRCALCGKPILGTYIFDDYGSKIHADHVDEVRQCMYCSRLISADSEGGEQYADGRVVCGICLKSAVTSKREADSLMRAVRDMLAAEGIVLDLKKIPLELVSRTRLAGIASDHRGNLNGFTKLTQRTQMLGLVTNTEFKIYMLDGAPRMIFISTAAHELMHVWFGLNGRFTTEDLLAEGSCNYASYLVLQNFGREADLAIDHLLENDDPIYGTGFRKVREYAERVGTSAWLDYLRSSDTPPW